MRIICSLSSAVLLLAAVTSSYAVQFDGSDPDPSDPLLYAWYDGNTALAADGIPETPFWASRTGNPNRDVRSAFGGDDAAGDLVPNAFNGNQAVQYVDLTSWRDASDADGEVWGTLPIEGAGVTVFAVAKMEDADKSFLFQGNQGGNSGAGAWANFSDQGGMMWEMFAGEASNPDSRLGNRRMAAPHLCLQARWNRRTLHRRYHAR